MVLVTPAVVETMDTYIKDDEKSKWTKESNKTCKSKQCWHERLSCAAVTIRMEIIDNVEGTTCKGLPTVAVTILSSLIFSGSEFARFHSCSFVC
jgi:hypothetical protein